MLLLDKPSQQTPFTLLFSEKIDPSLYAEAINNSHKLADSYNPETQASNLSIYAGTNLTYDNTGTVMGIGKDDTQQVDT